MNADPMVSFVVVLSAVELLRAHCKVGDVTLPFKDLILIISSLFEPLGVFTGKQPSPDIQFFDSFRLLP